MKKLLLNAIGILRHVFYAKGKQTYIPLKWRIVLAIPVAFSLVLIGKPLDVIGAMLRIRLDAVLLSTGINFLMVVAVSGFVHHATRWLDSWCSWHDRFGKRLTLQLVIPLLGSWLFSFSLIMVTFTCLGISIKDSGYLRFEIWVVFLLLAVMNTGYTGWYLYRRLLEKKEQENIENKKVTYIEVMDTLNRRKFQVSELEVAVVEVTGRYRLVRRMNGEINYAEDTIVELEKKLDPDRFYKLKRSHLINVGVVKRTESRKEPRNNGKKGASQPKYEWIVEYGNNQIGHYEGKLTKGNFKQFEAWWAHGKKKFNL